MDEYVMVKRETLEKTNSTWYYVETIGNGDMYLHETFKTDKLSAVWDYHVVTRIPSRLISNLRKFINNGD